MLICLLGARKNGKTIVNKGNDKSDGPRRGHQTGVVHACSPILGLSS